MKTNMLDQCPFVMAITWSVTLVKSVILQQGRSIYRYVMGNEAFKFKVYICCKLTALREITEIVLYSQFYLHLVSSTTLVHAF